MRLARWYHSLVRSRPDLYRAIYDFNTYPHRWMHPARLGARPPAVLENHLRARRRLGAHHREALDLGERHWDFTSPVLRLALLDTETLSRLACAVGAVVHAPRLARVIAREERRVVIAVIGETAFTYALRRGRFSQGPAGLAVQSAEDAPLGEAIIATGWRALGAALAVAPAAVHARFVLKAPPDVVLPARETVDADAAGQAWQFIQPIANETLTPEAVRCLS